MATGSRASGNAGKAIPKRQYGSDIHSAGENPHFGRAY